MSGSRSRTGCYTCRIRKKKCDEQHPRCQNCQVRKLQCYGYGAPPDWMFGKQSWKEIMDTEEARRIRSFAEVQYKARRRSGRDRSENSAGEPANCHQTSELALRRAWPPDPESLWWDGGLCTSLPSYRAAHEDARLLMIFLDVIHPIQFGFYHISTAADRT
jgi:hypothetical protein